jgi:hypothetical protein
MTRIDKILMGVALLLAIIAVDGCAGAEAPGPRGQCALQGSLRCGALPLSA